MQVSAALLSLVLAAAARGEWKAVSTQIEPSAAGKLERYVESCYPDGVRFERGVITAAEVLGE